MANCFLVNEYQTSIFSRAVIGIGVEEEDRKHTWMEDAESVRLRSFFYAIPCSMREQFFQIDSKCNVC